MNGKKVMALLIAGAMLIQAAPAQTFAAPQNVRTEKEKEESGSYSLSPPKTEKSFLRFIPYFAWGNRSPGEMLVWLRDKI